MKNVNAVILALAAAVAATGASAATGFGTDYGAACERARASGRSVFLLFTGSDWCPYCVKLEREVLSQREFLDVATNSWELVEIDFPRDTSRQTDAQRAANEKLSSRFGVRGFPTVLLTDPDGKVLHTSGYAPGGAAKWTAAFRSAAAAAPLVAAHLGAFREEAARHGDALRALFDEAAASSANWAAAREGLRRRAETLTADVSRLRELLAATEVPAAVESAKAADLNKLDRMAEAGRSLVALTLKETP